MTFLFTSLLIGLAGLSTPTPEPGPVFKPEMVPTTAVRTAAFVPTGWLLEKQISGDLNGDNRPDPVLMLVERPSASAPEARRERALVVLINEPSGQLRRVAASGTALYCTGCFNSDRTAAPDLAITKGTLAVRHLSGVAQTLDVTQRYRFEAGRVRLVGESVMQSSRLKLDTTYKRTDYLTGQQQTEHIVADPADPNGAKQLVTRKEAKVPTAPRFLEDVNVASLNL
ncbi:hypothetical protein [Hymenobacter jeollabukensis]|uniref:Uncharacterized protein n=1 Tax=Hymenobacter jeollabukensis TaxID=2025313 RepID=A0A5R8WLA9_9BACT|nr:hypothetical protein [Hymenobacter jeollabukensis]TLM89455.1 hypothetical protein FDY95_20500 [Hymenobacter jeollabukensis]